MQLTPPHSPPQDNSPFITGKMDTRTSEGLFAKRPISPPLSSGEISDAHSDDHANGKATYAHGQSQPPVSLLTALLHSPDSQHHHRMSTGASHPSSSSNTQGGFLSPNSSVPSTALSSPNLKPGQPAQQVPAMSILRRESVSSEGGEALHLSSAAAAAAGAGAGAVTTSAVSDSQTLDVRTELPKRASSLKFAVAPPSKRRLSEAPGKEHVPPVPKIKADFPAPHRSQTDETVSEEFPITVDDEAEEEEEAEEDDSKKSDSEDSDLGYQEDSEQSDDDQDRIRSAPKYPFARSTNYRRRRQAQARSPSPPPAPAVLPPPTRRGRGHIRVDSSCISGKETEGGCSRHRSPPPSKSRSRSNSGERIGRLSDAGPRQNRAGSPMPSRILEASSDEDEEESPVKPVASKPFAGHGWRSDDAAFYGPKAQVKGIRAVSAPSAMLSDEDDLDHEADGVLVSSSVGAGHLGGVSDTPHGMRSFFRRASEHLPAFRRPRPPVEPPLPLPSDAAHIIHAHVQSARSAIPPHACPPALDDTPALANSIARVETNYSGGLAHRLEKTLSTRASELHAHA